MLKKTIKKIPFLKMILKLLFSIALFAINYTIFLKDFFLFRSRQKSRKIKWSDCRPMINEKTTITPFDPHYIYHPAWAARILARIKPEKHIDISSKMDFSTMLSAFIPVEFYDFRPANIKLNNLECKSANLTKLDFESDSIQSLSCMHVVEHVGLGRYGDPIIPDGDILAMKELERVLKPGGYLLFVVPIGKSKIEFNAHRVYSYKQIISNFPNLKLKEFSLIPDNGIAVGIITNASEDMTDKQEYGCGCFWFTK